MTELPEIPYCKCQGHRIEKFGYDIHDSDFLVVCNFTGLNHRGKKATGVFGKVKHIHQAAAIASKARKISKSMMAYYTFAIAA